MTSPIPGRTWSLICVVVLELGEQQIELVSFRVSEHVPSLVAALPDMYRPCTSSEQPGKLRLLITIISRADVEMHAELAGLRLCGRLEYGHVDQATDASLPWAVVLLKVDQFR
jgi:hypothetical protein